MQDNKTIRIWQWAVLLLVICNVALLATIWIKPYHDNRTGGDQVRNYVIGELKFTDAQVKDYNLLINDHRQAMRQLNHDAMALRRQLFSGLKNSNPAGDFTTDSLANLIAYNQQQIELVTFHHFRQVRKLCTDEQKTKLDNIISEVTKQMNGHAGPPPRDSDAGPEQGPSSPGGQRPPPDGQRPPPPDGQGPPPDQRP